MASVEVSKAEAAGGLESKEPSLVGKLEDSVEIKSNAGDFHDVFSCRPHHISNVSPDNIQGCGMHEGDWGTPGSTIVWDYVHEGKKKFAKEIVEAIDHENYSTTFKVIEGDIMEYYKNFRLIVKATAKKDGEGSIVHWTLEYEKLHENIPDPTSLMEFTHAVSKDIDLHLQEVAAAAAGKNE
uniref:Bet v I/Major latex protein domain-containing protein n=1 Tax=Kalanchoe fedtschenkoi TaxID=63787 RepID=A0A7N0TCK4_KALFE